MKLKDDKSPPTDGDLQYYFDFGKNSDKSTIFITTDGGNWTTGTTTDGGNWTTGTTIATVSNYWPTGTTITTSNYTSDILKPGEEAWPIIKDTLGLVFIDNDLIKLRSKDGKIVVIGKLSDNDVEVIPLEVIAAKNKLLE